LFQNREPRYAYYLDIGGGKKGLYFVYKINFNNARIELYIDFNDKEMNKRFFDKLFQNKTEIETAIGENLVWDRLDGNRASTIRLMIDDNGLNDMKRWPELQDKMIQAMIKFEGTFKPYVDRRIDLNNMFIVLY
jgi:hypothetical protein